MVAAVNRYVSTRGLPARPEINVSVLNINTYHRGMFPRNILHNLLNKLPENWQMLALKTSFWFTIPPALAKDWPRIKWKVVEPLFCNFNSLDTLWTQIDTTPIRFPIRLKVTDILNTVCTTQWRNHRESQSVFRIWLISVSVNERETQ